LPFDRASPDRFSVISGFLAASGWGGAEVRPLAGDASFRRYYRVRRGAAGAVLMDAPPEKEDVRPFMRIGQHLARLGLSAPQMLAADVPAGLLLLEDFGDDTYTRLLDRGADAAELYGLAVDVLSFLHRLPHAVPAALPPYDIGRLLEEALLFTDWYLPAVTGAPTLPAVRDAYIAAWRCVLPLALASAPTLVLRDFHVDNLMRVAGRGGLAACGLLDFQDAVAGPPAYDLMSLLEDARRDVAPPLKAAMLDRYLRNAPGRDHAAFAQAFTVLAAQRHCKVIGIFTRLLRRDGKPIYLRHIPRVWRLLEEALAAPTLVPVADWFARHVPAHLRTPPPT
jgi:aminoglycoside/choline kinase family phosphotransferase